MWLEAKKTENLNQKGKTQADSRSSCQQGIKKLPRFLCPFFRENISFMYFEKKSELARKKRTENSSIHNKTGKKHVKKMGNLNGGSLNGGSDQGHQQNQKKNDGQVRRCGHRFQDLHAFAKG